MPEERKTAEVVLRAVEAAPEVKDAAWRAYEISQTPADFQRRFDAIKLPREVKAELFDLRFNGAAPGWLPKEGPTGEASAEPAWQRPLVNLESLAAEPLPAAGGMEPSKATGQLLPVPPAETVLPRVPDKVGIVPSEVLSPVPGVRAPLVASQGGATTPAPVRRPQAEPTAAERAVADATRTPVEALKHRFREPASARKERKGWRKRLPNPK